MRKLSRSDRPPSHSEVQSVVTLLQSGRYVEAEFAAKTALAAFPRALIFHNLLGSALSAQQKRAEGAESFERVAANSSPTL